MLVRYTLHGCSYRDLKSCFLFCIGFAVSADGNSIKCQVCSSQDPQERKGWMKRSSQKAHLASATHKRACAAQDAQRQVAAQRLRAIDAAGDFDAAQLNPVAISTVPEPRAGQTKEGAVGFQPTVGESEMWAAFERDGGDFEIEEFAEDREALAQERFEREVDTFGLLNPVKFATETGFSASQAGVLSDLLEELNAATMAEELDGALDHDMEGGPRTGKNTMCTAANCIRSPGVLQVLILPFIVRR